MLRSHGVGASGRPNDALQRTRASGAFGKERTAPGVAGYPDGEDRSSRTFAVQEDARSACPSSMAEASRGSREIAIHAVYPSTRHLSPKVTAFLDHLREGMIPPPWERGPLP